MSLWRRERLILQISLKDIHLAMDGRIESSGNISRPLLGYLTVYTQRPMPAVNIINLLPAKNYERQLCRCILKITRQKYRDIAVEINCRRQMRCLRFSRYSTQFYELSEADFEFWAPLLDGEYFETLSYR